VDDRVLSCESGRSRRPIRLMVNSRGASVARVDCDRSSADLERLILRRPAWRRCRPTCRAAASRPQMAEVSAASRTHCAILSCVTVKLSQTTSKRSSCGRKGISGPCCRAGCRGRHPEQQHLSVTTKLPFAIRAFSERFQRDFIRISTIPPRLETSLRCILFVSRGASMLITMQRGALQRPRDFGALFS
jgi:hypothetical protein